MNQPKERYCSVCSLDLDDRPASVEGHSSISTRTIVIVFLIIVALAFILWFIAALAAGGLSDT
jgi:hypothetical protein